MPSVLTDWTAVIPLRAGSKGLPGKNVRELAGKPLYRHSLDLALAAGAKRVLITTDIPEVLAAHHSDRVQAVQRPADLAGDEVDMAPVMLHILQAGAVSGPVVLLQATSPLRQAADVHKALALLASGKFELVMSVTEADSGVLKWGRVQEDASFEPLADPAHCFANRQSLPRVFRPNGAVYAMMAQWFVSNRGFVSTRIGTVVMPADRSHDIDNLSDFAHCEQKLAYLSNGQHP